MKILQLLPSLSYGDAVGNNTIALKHLIKELGYKTEIYAENIDSRLPIGTCYAIKDIPLLDENDIIIYHLAIGSQLNRQVANFKCRKIVIYHNITPPDYFKEYNPIPYKLCKEGLKDAKYLSNKVDYCLADSTFNKDNLIEMNYRCKIDVLPILVSFDDYKKKPNKEIINKYNKNTINIVFTGRIAPNKKQEDIIQAFYYYKKYLNKNAKLFLVGSYTGMEKYYEQLKVYIRDLDLSDVYFTGHIKFNEIIAYYKIADVFLCMSEHEGFCVPLLEAMYFDIPIIAYDSSAIANTLGGSGILLKDKDPIITAELIHRLVNDNNLKQKVIYNQRIKLKDFQYDVIKKQFIEYLKAFIGEM